MGGASVEERRLFDRARRLPGPVSDLLLRPSVFCEVHSTTGGPSTSRGLDSKDAANTATVVSHCTHRSHDVLPIMCDGRKPVRHASGSTITC